MRPSTQHRTRVGRAPVRNPRILPQFDNAVQLGLRVVSPLRTCVPEIFSRAETRLAASTRPPGPITHCPGLHIVAELLQRAAVFAPVRRQFQLGSVMRIPRESRTMRNFPVNLADFAQRAHTRVFESPDALTARVASPIAGSTRRNAPHRQVRLRRHTRCCVFTPADCRFRRVAPATLRHAPCVARRPGSRCERHAMHHR